MSTMIDPEELKIFIEELDELTQILEEDVVKIEKYPDDPSLIAEIFRAAHTIKGSSATMGFGTLAELTHAMESVFAAVRAGTLKINENIVTTFLLCTDALRAICTEITDSGTVTFDTPQLIERLKLLNAAPAPPKEVDRKQDDSNKRLLVKLDVVSDCVMPYARAFQVLSYLSEVGEVVRSTPSAGEIEREKRAFPLHVVLSTSQSDKKVEHVIGMISEVVLTDISEVADSANVHSHVDDTVDEDDDVHEEQPDLLSEEAPEDEAAEPAAPVVEPQLEKPVSSGAPPAIEHKPKAPAGKSAPKIISKLSAQSMRVDVERIDTIVDLVGELVVNRTLLTQLSREIEAMHEGDEPVRRLNDAADHIELISSLLQEQVMKTRLFPVENVFNKFPRMVRDLAGKCGKKVELTIRGEKTELDRAVLEEIGDPLMHILRNSVDHGIEKEEDRIRAGKSGSGEIRINAEHIEEHIIITVEDDGRGIDVAAVREKAKKTGLLPVEMIDRLSDTDAINLVFTPGFSTSSKVSDVSGRGVGMDVVRTNIEKLNGSVTLSSVAGKGTSITIRLPLTLAIIKSLLVALGDGIYAFPLSVVVQGMMIRTGDIQTVKGNETVLFRGDVIPVYRLAAIIGRSAADGARKRMFLVVVNWGGRRLGIIVDRLLGEQEIVIRPLGEYIGEVTGITGATILGDGRIALVMDVGGLLKKTLSGCDMFLLGAGGSGAEAAASGIELTKTGQNI